VLHLLVEAGAARRDARIGALERGCLDSFLCFSLGHVDHIGQQYVRFFNGHRPH
jgi:hypothetical protein